MFPLVITLSLTNFSPEFDTKYHLDKLIIVILSQESELIQVCIHFSKTPSTRECNRSRPKFVGWCKSKKLTLKESDKRTFFDNGDSSSTMFVDLVYIQIKSKQGVSIESSAFEIYASCYSFFVLRNEIIEWITS